MKENIEIRNVLTKIGCTNEEITKISQMDHDEDRLTALKKQRCLLMDELHECGKKIDVLDQLIRKEKTK
jgi:hypothetical protein